MNAFFEHHQHSIRLAYRCFDRLLLNGLIQPFQQPERVIGFFNSYREGKRVTRDLLHEIADQFKNWVTNRSQEWKAPILEAPEGRRDDFIDPYFERAKADEVVAILRAREPARILMPTETRKMTGGICNWPSAGSFNTTSTSTTHAGDGCSSGCVPTFRSLRGSA
jgi:hypothetical protein